MQQLRKKFGGGEIVESVKQVVLEDSNVPKLHNCGYMAFDIFSKPMELHSTEYANFFKFFGDPRRAADCDKKNKLNYKMQDTISRYRMEK